MYYKFKSIIMTVLFVIWTVIIFFVGMSFGSPQKIINQLEPQIEKTNAKKINERIQVESTEGNITFTITNAIYTRESSNKKISFDVQVETTTAHTYLLILKDEQNQNITLRSISRANQQPKTASFEFVIPQEKENADVFLFLYPATKETLDSKDIKDKAYSKILLSIPEIKQKTIENLK